MNEPIHPYEPLVDHAAGLHTMDGRWRRSPFQRRMTVIRRSDGKRRFLEGFGAPI